MSLKTPLNQNLDIKCPKCNHKFVYNLNLDDIKEIYPDITNEEYLCGFSAARETDNMFKLLLEKLKEEIIDILES